MKWEIVGKRLHITPKPFFRVRGGVKVLFYREVDEREETTYPIAVADLPRSGILDWIDGVQIFRVEVRRPRFFGLLGYKWELATQIKK